MFITEMSDGGAQKQLALLANEWSTWASIDVHVVRLRPGPHDRLLGLDADQMHWIEARSNFDPRIAVKLGAFLRKKRIDVLLTWLLPSDIIGYVAALQSSKTKWFMTERDSRHPNRLRTRLRDKIGQRAVAIIANSRAGRQYWLSRDVRVPVLVVNNIAPTQDKMFCGSSADKAGIISVGRLEPQKNPVLVMRVLLALSVAQPDLKCSVVGQGSMKDSVQHELLQASDDASIQMHGFRHDVAQLLAKAKVLLTLSQHEGQPNVLLEAIANKTLPVASKIPEHVDVLGPEYPYYVCGDAPVDEIVTICIRALDDDDASCLAFAQRKLTRMTPTAIADAYVNIFDEYASEGKA